MLAQLHTITTRTPAPPRPCLQVVKVAEWHINADEPEVLAYPEDFKSAAQQAAYYAPTPYRSSDHGEQGLRVQGLGTDAEPMDCCCTCPVPYDGFA